MSSPFRARSPLLWPNSSRSSFSATGKVRRSAVQQQSRSVQRIAAGDILLPSHTEEGTRKATEFTLKPFGSIRVTRSPMRIYLCMATTRGLRGWVAPKPTKPLPRRGTQPRPPCRSRPISPPGTKRSATYSHTGLDFAGAEAEFRRAEKLAPADAGPKVALCFSSLRKAGWQSRRT